MRDHIIFSITQSVVHLPKKFYKHEIKMLTEGKVSTLWIFILHILFLVNAREMRQLYEIIKMLYIFLLR